METEKQAEFSRHVQRKLDQYWQYDYTGLHPDVTGNLGGIECIVATLEPREGADTHDDIMVAYILVDAFDTVRCVNQGEPSRWDVARLLCRAMRAGIPRHRLRHAIDRTIREYVGAINADELLAVELARQTPPREVVAPPDTVRE